MNNNIESIINERGRPTVFITAIANSDWNQISNQLMKDQSCNDRPDVVGRCFQFKLKLLLRNLRNGTYFNGNIMEYVFFSITWRKGQLPVVHILAKLINENDISVSHHSQAIMDWDGYIKFLITNNSNDITKYIDFILKAEIKFVQVYVN
jgi:hypothetical protein